MLSKVNYNFPLLIGLTIVLVVIVPFNAYADTFKVQIPAGASGVDFPTHFVPDEISIRSGDVVEWGNTDGEVHTVTSGSLLTGIENKFDSGPIKSGEKFRHVFVEEFGEVKYFCTMHPWMTGIINVADIPEGFQVIHNVGEKVSDITFDLQYKVQRNLTDIEVDTVRDMLVFNFVGKIDNDIFEIYLPERLIENPQTVWVGDKQITNFELESINGMNKINIPLQGNTNQVLVVGTDVIGELTPKPYVLINQVFAVTDRQIYNLGDTITISGEIKNISQLSSITPQITSPQGVILYSENILLMGPRFTIEIDSDELREFGQYKVSFVGKEVKGPILYFEYKLAEKAQQSPKKQMETVSPKDVICNEGLVLMMKISDNSAVCLTPQTANTLKDRGWASEF